MNIGRDLYSPYHGVDGWDLIEQDWNPDNDVATLVYERTLIGQPTQIATLEMPQPTNPSHIGWAERSGH